MRRIALVMSTAVAGVTLAACGSSSGGGGSSASGASATSGAGGAYSTDGAYSAPTAAPTTPPAGASAAAGTGSAAAALGVRTNKLGTILVDGAGQTLYLFEADKGTTSACSGPCANAWPPYVASGAPKATTGVSTAEIGTTNRPDGTRQVTYNGHPLYYFVKDSAPGDTTGQGILGFGAKWYVLGPDGNKIDKD